MSDDSPETVAPVLRREALLPTERNRGLGTVAVVCTMAGVASGLALATTLMAMQVADTMSTHSCRYQTAEITSVRPDHGFLGIRYVFKNGVAQVDSVMPGTPAAAINLQPGDLVIAINGDRIDSATELQDKIFGSYAGARPLITIERDGVQRTLRPTLVSWPALRF
jgi:S1-C subfamily serine protease